MHNLPQDAYHTHTSARGTLICEHPAAVLEYSILQSSIEYTLKPGVFAIIGRVDANQSWHAAKDTISTANRLQQDVQADGGGDI